MLKRQRAKKATAKQKARIGKDGSKFLNCKVCEVIEVKTSYDTVAVTCRYCVAKSVAAPDGPKYLERSGKPRGWHFKKYFEHEGNVYVKGIQITDPDEIAELRVANNPKAKRKKKAAEANKPTPKKKDIKSNQPAKKRGRPRANTSR